MVIVLNQHFLGTFCKELEYNASLASFLWNGHFAVAIFFLLSGFGMAYSRLLRTQKESAFTIMSSILKRYIRFTVSILMVCCITFWLNQFGIFTSARNGFSGDLSGIQLERITSWTSILEDGLWKILFVGETRYNMVLWTMKYEWFASIYMIVLFYFIEGRTWIIRYGMYLLSCFIALIIDPIYCTFMVGVVFADLFVSIKKLHKNFFGKRILGYILLTCGCILGSYPSYGQSSWWDVLLPNSRLVMQMTHVLAAMLVVGGFILLNTDKKWPKWLGHVSAATYEMYLIHVMIIYTIGVCIYKIVSIANVNSVAILVSYIAVVIVTVIIGLFINKICSFANRRKDT